MADNVNHPAHYETGKFECIDVMVETQGVEATQNFCVCNALKYVYRHKKKEKWHGGFTESNLVSEQSR